jgi:hypothetical protein
LRSLSPPFTGDSLLDFMLLEHFFDHYEESSLSPKHLTVIRSLVVCNEFFGFLTAKYELYKFLEINPTLTSPVNRFLLHIQPLLEKETKLSSDQIQTLDPPKVHTSQLLSLLHFISFYNQIINKLFSLFFLNEEYSFFAFCE